MRMLFSFILMMLFVGTAWADTLETDPNERELNIPTEGWSNGAFLGPNWWIKNPKNLPPVPDLWLYHLDLSYSYGEQSGNLQSTRHNGEIALYLRKDLLTTITYYKAAHSETSQQLTGNQIATDNHTFRQVFRYPLTDRLTLAARYVWERNEGKYIEDRTMIYGGLRYYAIRENDLDFFIGAFYGPKTSTSYMSSKIRQMRPYRDFPDVADYDSHSVYIGTQLVWKITDTISFEQEAEYMNFLKDSDYYFLRLNHKLNFKLSNRTSLFIAHSIDRDSNLFVDDVNDYMAAQRAQNLPHGKMDKTDTQLTIGIKLSF